MHGNVNAVPRGTKASVRASTGAQAISPCSGESSGRLRLVRARCASALQRSATRWHERAHDVVDERRRTGRRPHLRHRDPA